MQDSELDDLFNTIIYEIEERQEHLEHIAAQGNVEKEVEERIKREIT